VKALLRLNFGKAVPGGVEIMVEVKGDLFRDRNGDLCCHVKLPEKLTVPIHALDVPISLHESSVVEWLIVTNKERLR